MAKRGIMVFLLVHSRSKCCRWYNRKIALNKNFLNYSYDLVKVEMKLYWPTKRQNKALTHYKHPVRSLVGLLVGRNRIVDESMIFDSLSKPNDYTFQLIYSLPFFFSFTLITYRFLFICFFFRNGFALLRSTSAYPIIR